MAPFHRYRRPSAIILMLSLCAGIASCSTWRESTVYPVPRATLLADLRGVLERQGFPITKSDETACEIETGWNTSGDPILGGNKRVRIEARVEEAGSGARALIKALRETDISTDETPSDWSPDGRDYDLEDKILMILRLDRMKRRTINER